jgi:hypothetical protein
MQKNNTSKTYNENKQTKEIIYDWFNSWILFLPSLVLDSLASALTPLSSLVAVATLRKVLRLSSRPEADLLSGGSSSILPTAREVNAWTTEVFFSIFSVVRTAPFPADDGLGTPSLPVVKVWGN